MSIIIKYVTAIMAKYRIPVEKIHVDNRESFVFEPEELQGISDNPEVSLESRIITTFPVVIKTESKFAHVIAERGTYRILDIIITE